MHALDQQYKSLAASNRPHAKGFPRLGGIHMEGGNAQYILHKITLYPVSIFHGNAVLCYVR